MEAVPRTWEGRGGALCNIFPTPLNGVQAHNSPSHGRTGAGLLPLKDSSWEQLKGSEGCLVTIRVGVSVQSGTSMVATEDRMALEMSQGISRRYL